MTNRLDNRAMSKDGDRLSFHTSDGRAYVASLEEIQGMEAWRRAFFEHRKDHRFYNLAQETLTEGFSYSYLVFENKSGSVDAIQPFFYVNQDLTTGMGKTPKRIIATIRRRFPRFLIQKMLMVGCVAGEGHLCFTQPNEQAERLVRSLHEVLLPQGRRSKSSLIVLKEFPSSYRGVLRRFSSNGYARVPSMPSVKLDLNFSDFNEYMETRLSKVTRKNLRRKFREVAQTEPIEMQAMNDLTPYVDEVYPLYLQVYERAVLKFEKLTKDYLRRLGQEMPDRARFFIWRQGGKPIAFSICMAHGDALYDEYIGLDYPAALNLHLYYYTMRDILEWAVKSGFKTYYSTALTYDPKYHLRFSLAPQDLYVRHTSRVVNFFLRRLAPVLEPTRADPILKKFHNAHEL